MTRGGIQGYKEAVRKAWEASDRLCAQRLKPLVGEMVSAMRRHGELAVDAQIEAELCRTSPATMERLNLVYDTLRLYVNFFQPTMELVSRSRQGARVHEVYDQARTLINGLWSPVCPPRPGKPNWRQYIGGLTRSCC
jgi:hypothetical protein